jgi:hypothetical protein
VATLIREDGKELVVNEDELLQILNLAADFGAYVPPLIMGVSKGEAQAIADSIEYAIKYLKELEEKGEVNSGLGFLGMFQKKKKRRQQYLWQSHEEEAWSGFIAYCRGSCFEVDYGYVKYFNKHFLGLKFNSSARKRINAT